MSRKPKSGASGKILRKLTPTTWSQGKHADPLQLSRIGGYWSGVTKIYEGLHNLSLVLLMRSSDPETLLRYRIKHVPTNMIWHPKLLFEELFSYELEKENRLKAVKQNVFGNRVSMKEMYPFYSPVDEEDI